MGAGAEERSGGQKAVVALANKNARILWAIMTKGTRFERNHKSEKPGPVAAPPAVSPAPALATGAPAS